MSEARFWELVSVDKDERDPTPVLARRLAELSPSELVAYQRHFDALVARSYTWDLWGACYVVEGGCSDDGFEYFRYGLLTRGRATYEAALTNADSLAELPHVDLEREDVAYVAHRLYEERAGKKMPATGVPFPKQPAGERWDFEDKAERERRLPRLLKAASRLEQERMEMAKRALESFPGPPAPEPE